MSASNVTPKKLRTGENTLVLIMFFAAGIVFLDRFGITYLFPQIGAEFHLDNAQLASLTSITAVTWAVSSLLFSVISDRLGGKNKIIIISSLVLFSAAVLVVGLAPNFGTLLLLRAVIGFCEGPALPLIQGAVARASSPHRVGRNLGIVIAGTTVIGGAFAPTIMIGLASAYGWRGAFPIVAAPGILIAILVAIFMKKTTATGAAESPRVKASDFGKVLVNRNALLALIGTAVCIFEVLGVTTFQTTYLAKAGMSSSELTLVLTISGILAAIGTVFSPALSDRIGRKPALFISGICLGLMPLAMLLFAHNVPLLLVSLAVQIMGAGSLPLLTFIIPADSVPKELTATAFAIQVAIGETLGGILGPLVGGQVADANHSVGAAMVLYAIVPIVVVVLSLLIKESAPRKRPEGTAAITVIEEASREAALP